MLIPAPFKILLLSAAFCFVALCCYSQKTELRANAYSGLFSFRSSGAASAANISIVGPADGPGLFTAYPYGKKSGFSYAFELQAQRVTAQRHLFGAGVGFEKLQSKVGFDSVSTQVGIKSTKGNIRLTNEFVTFNPYIGHRFALKKILFDVTAGADIAFSTKVYSKAKINFEKESTFSNTYKKHPVDVRPRVQLNMYYKRMGLLAGYSIGTEDVYKNTGYDYLNKKAFANFLRLGISYRLN